MQDEIRTLQNQMEEKGQERDSLSSFASFMINFPLSHSEFVYDEDSTSLKKKKEQMFNDYQKIHKDSLVKDQSSLETQMYNLNSKITDLRNDIESNEMLRSGIRY